ncbi:MAG: site-2 protease family protein [Terriglobales bacterium]
MEEESAAQFWRVQNFWYIPRLEREPLPLPRWRVALLLLAATLVTTMVVGARLQYNFALHQPSYLNNADLFPFPWVGHHPGLMALGWPFSLALMGILLAHELGHFLACRHYRLEATWPMFLPAPTLIGTMGAFIRIKASFHDRRELFDVGIAGPLAGMAVTLPLLWIGVAHSRVLSLAQAAAWHRQWIEFGWPRLGQWAAGWLHPGVPASRIALSPVARAAWMGLLLTMLNLLPAAQLDGGHVLYAISPRLHRAASWCVLAFLVWAGWRSWAGWYVFAAFIALMRVRHPYVPAGAGREAAGGAAGELGWMRLALAVLALAIFLACFCLAPLMAG